MLPSFVFSFFTCVNGRPGPQSSLSSPSNNNSREQNQPQQTGDIKDMHILVTLSALAALAVAASLSTLTLTTSLFAANAIVGDSVAAPASSGSQATTAPALSTENDNDTSTTIPGNDDIVGVGSSHNDRASAALHNDDIVGGSSHNDRAPAALHNDTTTAVDDRISSSSNDRAKMKTNSASAQKNSARHDAMVQEHQEHRFLAPPTTSRCSRVAEQM
jgi:hypothetical protein